MRSREPKTGPCHNPRCPHDGTAPFIEVEWPAKVRVSGLCEGCQADELERERRVDADHRAALVNQLASERMREWSLASYPEDESGRSAKHEGLLWLDRHRAGSRENLILTGGVGVGKTGLAWALVRDLIEQEPEIPDVGFVNFRDYLEDAKRAFAERVEPDRRPMRRDLLVLDDLGAERPTDFALNELASLVEYRYGRELPTIVTSNYSMQDLAKRLGHDDLIIGQRIVSRLVENSVRIVVQGDDRR